MLDMLNQMLPLLAVPLAALLCDLIVQFRRKLNKDTTAQDRNSMEGELETSINAAIALLLREEPDIMANGLTSPIVQQRVMAGAVAYMRQRFAERTAQISAAAGPGTRATDVNAALQQTLGARLIKIIPDVPSLPGLGAPVSASAFLPATTLPAPPS